MMIPLIEFQERSLTGPVMNTMEFDLAFSKKLRELVAKYDIQYDPEQFIVDDKTADAIFEAGVELLAEVGLYHLDTQRVIQYTKDEVLEIARDYRENPAEAVFGSGDDRISVRYRRCDDPEPPVLAAGPTMNTDQAWFDVYVRSFVEEPGNKALGIAGGLPSVNGIVPKAGTVSEMICAQWECERLLKIARDAGRPGMHLGLLSTASTAAATMACMRPGLRDGTNTQIGVHIIPEQKLDWTRLILSKFCEDNGITPWTSCVSVLGGLCRDGADVAVGIIANLLGQLSYGHGSLASMFTNHLDGTYADAPTIWAFSGACRASERNIRVPIAAVCAPNANVGRTATGFYQGAAVTIANTASGFSYAWIAGGSGPEARFFGDVMKATAGLKPDEAVPLIKACLDASKASASPDDRLIEFPEVYDLKTGDPTPEFVGTMDRVRDDLVKLGVPLR
jgi:hypothetical protein